MITQTRLRELLHYDTITGQFTWLKRTGSQSAGQPAGTRWTGRYGAESIMIRVDGERHQAHRLAWLYATGEWPNGTIDHRNGNPLDNRIENLRDVSHAVNMQNRRDAQANSRTGVLGVSPHQGGFRARICVYGRETLIGVYRTVEEAHAAYLGAKRLLHEGCTI